MRVAPNYRSLIENQAAQRTRSVARQGGRPACLQNGRLPLRLTSGGQGRVTSITALSAVPASGCYPVEAEIPAQETRTRR